MGHGDLESPSLSVQENLEMAIEFDMLLCQSCADRARLAVCTTRVEQIKSARHHANQNNRTSADVENENECQ